MTEARRGLLYGVIAYAFWGVIPIYWKLLVDVPAVEVLAHRIVWGVGAFLTIVVAARAQPALRAALRDLRTVGVMAISGVLLAINWGTFVWAVSAGHLLDASLGYFINPLVSVALGMVFLRERLRPLQWVAIALAACGVGLLTFDAGQAPWISLVLAVSFGLYGLVRKTARVDSLVGSTIETLLLTPVAITYLLVLAVQGGGAIGQASAATQALLAATGFVTAVPLILFNSAARRLPLSTIGFLQYLAPTGQCLIAVLLFGEPFARSRLVAFCLIWAALAVFSLHVWRARDGAARP